MGTSAETYLNLLLGDILGLEVVSFKPQNMCCGGTAYQVAHDNLAVALCGSRVGGSSLTTGIAGRLGSLLDTSSRSDNGGSGTSGRAALRATAASRSTALRGGDLVEGLVELARHVDECSAE